MSETVTNQTENEEHGDPEKYLAGAVPILLAAEPPWGSEAWFARYGSLASYKLAKAVEEAVAAGVGSATMAEIVGAALDEKNYDAHSVVSEIRSMICLKSLGVYEPRSNDALVKFEAGGWKNTAELLATLSHVLDYVAATQGDEMAEKLLNFRPLNVAELEQLAHE